METNISIETSVNGNFWVSSVNANAFNDFYDVISKSMIVMSRGWELRLVANFSFFALQKSLWESSTEYNFESLRSMVSDLISSSKRPPSQVFGNLAWKDIINSIGSGKEYSTENQDRSVKIMKVLSKVKTINDLPFEVKFMLGKEPHHDIGERMWSEEIIRDYFDGDMFYFLSKLPFTEGWYEEAVFQRYNELKDQSLYLAHISQSMGNLLGVNGYSWDKFRETSLKCPLLVNHILSQDDVDGFTEETYKIYLEDPLLAGYRLGFPVHLGTPSKEVIKSLCKRLVELGPDKYTEEMGYKNTSSQIVGLKYKDEENYSQYNSFDVITYVRENTLHRVLRNDWCNALQYVSPYVSSEINNRMIVCQTFPSCATIKDLISNSSLPKETPSSPKESSSLPKEEEITKISLPESLSPLLALLTPSSKDDAEKKQSVEDIGKKFLKMYLTDFPRANESSIDYIMRMYGKINHL